MANIRFSRPDGISQLNRSNIFFLILRRLTDEQRTLISGTSNDLVMRGIAGAIFPLLLFIHINTVAHVWVFFVAMELVNAGALLLQYLQLRRLLSETIITSVEEMIYSNDYQSANLNNEELVNMTNRCSWINGRLTEYSFEGRITTIAIVAMECLVWLSMFCFWI